LDDKKSSNKKNKTKGEERRGTETKKIVKPSKITIKII
jgi:hypothetical protein